MSNIQLFEDKKIRSLWNEDEEQWYFSVIDIIEVLTESSIPKRYWTDLKKKLTKEGSQLYENIVQLKFMSSDGKKYATDCLNTNHLFRLIQSIPSPKAEPSKFLFN
jgi:BRO family, N-terminal domain